MYRRDFLKFGVVAAAACAGVTTLSGCASSKPSDVYGVRTVRVATGGEGEPYSYIDSSGNWTGLCADMWKRVSEISGWSIEGIDSGNANSTFSDVMAGKADVAANGYYITSKRLELYLACDPLFADAQVIAVKEDGDASSLEDLRGKTIGVVSGRAPQSSVEALAQSYGWKVKGYDSSTLAAKDCASGAIDGYADYVTEIKGAERGQGVTLKIIDEALAGSNVTWFTISSDKDLRDNLNKIIKVMHEDGSLAELTTKWFKEDLTHYMNDAFLKATK